MIIFKTTQGMDKFNHAKKIREIVFVNEQQFINEFDDIDKIAFHVVAYENDKPAACARFFKEDEQYIIGRIAVIKELRGKGLGADIVDFCEKEIIKLGGKSTSLSAQVRAMEFYKKIGYSPIGEQYMEEHVPHIKMTKKL